MKIKTMPLGLFAEFRNGINYVAADTGDTVKVVGVGDFRDRTKLDSFAALSTITIKGCLSAEDELCDGDLLLVRSNGNKDLIGRCLIIRNPPPGVTFSGFTIRARVDRSVALPEFVALLFQGHAIKNHLLLAGGGNGNIANLNQAMLRELEVPVPAIATQRTMLAVLSTWDAAIEKTERLIAARERHYTHELSRLISRAQHPHGHIGAFARELSERNRQGNERVLSVTNSRGFVLPEEQFERRVASADLSNYKVVRRGQYAYNPSRINVGSIARLDDWGDGVLSPMYVVFEIDQTKVDSDYFVHWLASHEAQQRIKNSAQGSVRETVAFGDFAAIHFPLPKRERQTRIAAYLSCLRDEVALLERQANQLRFQKRGLMQKLLTGEWRVPVAEEAVA